MIKESLPLSNLTNGKIGKQKLWEETIAYFFFWYDTDHTENNSRDNTSVVTCVFMTTLIFLPGRFSNNEGI
jgi:uncharacterized protein YcfL